MNQRLRYALIGCGRIAPNHIAAAMKNSDTLSLCAVCDLIPERMETVLDPVPVKTRNTVARYSDYRKMLTEVHPQLVAIATESGRHAQIGLDCIAAGANVIIEKPLALSMKDAQAICTLLGWPIKDGNNSTFAGDGFEMMKKPFRGTHGHIAIGCNDIRRARWHLEQRGFAFDDDSVTIRDGKLRSVYLRDEIAGFAFHLLQK